MDTQQQIVQTLHRLLTLGNTWPTWETVDHELDTVLGLADPWGTVRDVDRRLLWGIGDREPADHQQVGLSIAGLATCPTAHEDIAVFVDSVQHAVEVAKHLPPPAELKLTPEDLTEHLRLPAAGRADLLKRQSALWQTANGLWTSLSGGPGSSEWSVHLNRRTLRRLRGFASVEDYLRVLESQQDDSCDGDEPNSHGRNPAVRSRSRPDAVPSSDQPRSADEAGQSRAAAPRTETVRSDSGADYTLYLDEQLGKGGQGTVFAGEGASGEPVAIKRVDLRSFDTEKWYRDARYGEREAVVNAYLEGRHLNYVMPLLDHVLAEDAFILVYPRAAMSLEDVVRLVYERRIAAESPSTPAPTPARDHFGADGPTSEQTRALAVELARGLVELHEHGVLHRDVKPGNALYYQDRWLWGDLGTARLTEAATATYTLREVGTLEYQAPEITSGASATRRSDIYALGCTIYALVTGKPPFTGHDTARKHREAMPDLTVIDDAELAHVLSYMLNKQPGARPDGEWVVDMLTSAPSGPTADALRRIGAAANRRENERSAAHAWSTAREQAAEDAVVQLDQFWDRLAVHVKTLLPTVEQHRGHGAWLLSLGDRRLVVQIGEPASGQCPAVQLGTVTVEAESRGPRTVVANICAFLNDEGAPVWHLLRMVRNDLAINPVPVSEALSDKVGALSIQDLEEHFRQREQGVAAKSATTQIECVLTVDALAGLFAAEVAAIDAYLDDA